jgi:hypothetical protein
MLLIVKLWYTHYSFYRRKYFIPKKLQDKTKWKLLKMEIIACVVLQVFAFNLAVIGQILGIPLGYGINKLRNDFHKNRLNKNWFVN